MAIAGSSQDAFKLTPRGNELINHGCRRVGPGLVEEDIAKALQKLLAGETVHLLAYGDNLAQMMRRWEEYHDPLL